MGLVDLASVTAALATLFQPEVVTQINRAVVLGQLLPFKPGSGKNLQWDVEFGTDAPADSTLGDGVDVTTFEDDEVTPAVLQWGTFSDAISVSGKALAAAAVVNNPQELYDLFAFKIERSVRRLARGINKEAYSGTGATNHLHGLTATAGGLRATGTYAGIDRAVKTQWQANEFANGGVPRPMTMELLRAVRRGIFTNSGEFPDMIVSDQFQWDKYGALQESNRRFEQAVTVRGQKVVLDGGYRALDFEGIPWIADVNAPAGKVLFLNSRYVFLRQLPDAPGGVEDGRGRMELHGTPEYQLGAGMMKLSARINPLAITGDAYKFQLILYPQIQVERPNAQGLLSDLVTT